MFIPGLCAISFRKHNIEDIAASAARSGLSFIEWGSDVSVPSGKTDIAESARALSDSLTLRSPSYGSYFKLGIHKTDELLPILENAKILGSSTVRIWGYNALVTPEDPVTWKMLVDAARAVANIASAYGITLALECHNNTLTEHYENALRFLSDVDMSALRMYWQPNHLCSYEYNLDSIKALSPYVDVIHAFNWDKAGKYPLADAKDVWRAYLTAFSNEAKSRDIPVLLEFMPDGNIASLPHEASALLDIISSL